MNILNKFGGIRIKFKLIIFIVHLVCFLHSEQILSSEKIKIPGKDYYTDVSGNIYMYINVLGHVKNPGSYLIYEDADLFSILARAGGSLPGAKSNIMLYQFSSVSTLILGDKDVFNLKPNDTIYVKENVVSYLFSKSTIINSILGVLNIYLTITLTR